MPDYPIDSQPRPLLGSKVKYTALLQQRQQLGKSSSGLRQNPSLVKFQIRR